MSFVSIWWRTAGADMQSPYTSGAAGCSRADCSVNSSLHTLHAWSSWLPPLLWGAVTLYNTHREAPTTDSCAEKAIDVFELDDHVSSAWMVLAIIGISQDASLRGGRPRLEDVEFCQEAQETSWTDKKRRGYKYKYRRLMETACGRCNF